MRGERLEHPGAALARAVVAFEHRGDEREPAVAERDEVARHGVGRLSVVEADARMPPASVHAPGEHVGAREFLKQHVELVVVEPDEDEGFHPALEHGPGVAHLGGEVVGCAARSSE